MGEIEEADVGIDGQNHAFHLGDIGVFPAEIGEESNDGFGRGADGGGRSDTEHGDDKGGKAKNTGSA